jgi:oxygen-independent coproporphyrinogen-3 oxidase
MHKQLKVNRISLGVQSLCDEIIKQSKRLDTERKALKAIELAKATGAVVNIDLLSGLAGETQDTWAYTLKRALAIDVESITVYKMELFANSEYFMDVRNQTIALPSDEQELEFMRYALDQFAQTNYLPWSFFTFTKQGRYEHQYATSIWRGVDCYPFGVSAFGGLGNWLFQNTNDLEKYITMVESDEIPINRGYHLTCFDQMVRAVMLGLKLVRFDLQDFQRKYGLRLERLCASSLKQLEQEGFITLSAHEITLTIKGILYGDHVGKTVAQDLLEMEKEIV